MTENLLEISDLKKSFGGVRAVNKVNLTVQFGEVHAVIGPNGAGKSTLVQLIAGSLKPDSGRIKLLGCHVNDMSVAKRANLGLGRTFQVSNLALEFSALRNIMIAIQGRSHSWFRFYSDVMKDVAMLNEARNWLKFVGLGEKEKLLASELSHGDCRKLEIASCLALEPRLMLLDEPMAGLGVEGTAEVTGLLREIRKDTGILLIEHDMDVVFSLADRVSVLVYGEIIATGTMDEIRNNKRVRQAYLGDDNA